MLQLNCPYIPSQSLERLPVNQQIAVYKYKRVLSLVDR
jgi:hypothetical protein